MLRGPPIVHRLTVTRTGVGEGTVTSVPAGISCGSVCVGNFDEGDSPQAVLFAKADPGSVFKGWAGACSGNKLTCEVGLARERTVAAAIETAPVSPEPVVPPTPPEPVKPARPSPCLTARWFA